AQMTKAQHFRFLATLGMTEIRDKIIATNPFYLPLSAHNGRGVVLIAACGMIGLMFCVVKSGPDRGFD
ncbi:MAG: hypothetical protein OXI33_10400, partial [Chloroflexota bacterium]|nr:hypothetical protein [Chloroflexota bacterium]